jgi:hypothetical protein
MRFAENESLALMEPGAMVIPRECLIYILRMGCIHHGIKSDENLIWE